MIKFVVFHMLAKPAQKQKVTWFSQQFQFYNNKIENFGKIWVVDAGYLWFNWLFLFIHSDLNIGHCFLCYFCDIFISSSTFCSW